MNFEEEIFKRRTVEFDKLEAYGFKKEGKNYQFSKYILDGSLRIDITVSSDGKVLGKIYDLSFDDEYTNYRVKSYMGTFVNTVKEEFINLLEDIRDNCTSKDYFIGKQTNRIAKKIINTYGDIPEFLWERYPGFGIFRNPHNKKWYAIIMNIDKSKIDVESGEVEIINVKVGSNKISDILGKKGFYKAYHMSKNSWITIILDDTVDDEEILKYVFEGHKLVGSKK